LRLSSGRNSTLILWLNYQFVFRLTAKDSAKPSFR
jgi:hypothetical protein